jgi:hypothetical protein
MKKPVLLLVSIVCALGVVNVPVLADTVKDNSQQISKLEKQLAHLQQEVTALKQQKTHPEKINRAARRPVPTPPSGTGTAVKITPPGLSPYNKNQIPGAADLPAGKTPYLPVDFDVPGQSFVSSGPYIGIPLEYAGSNLIINSPNVNEDIILLQLRKNIMQRLETFGRPEEASGSHILLSGSIQGQALGTHSSGSASQSDINLTSADLDAYILGPSSWTSGLIELGYDNNIGTQTGSFSSNNRTQNSRVFVNKAFIVLGDVIQSPFYASFGQMYVPFGTYSTTLVSDPLTKILARTQARALVLGYKQLMVNNFYASTYIFKGASHASSTSRINNGGINLGYGFKMGAAVNADIGGGVIASIADSQGMQFTGNQPLFAGFGGPTVTVNTTTGTATLNTGNEKLVHRVPAYDVHALLGWGSNIQLLGEYIAASTNFNVNDMTLNSHGAKPQALNLEGVYNISWFIKPTSLSMAYGMSKNALAMGLPAKRYSLVLNRSGWKNTLQSLELRHDVNYSSRTSSSGSNQPGPVGTGNTANTIILQFAYYF